MRIFLILSLCLIFASGCAPSMEVWVPAAPFIEEQATPPTPPEYDPAETPAYPGVSIDEVFPVVFHKAFMDSDEEKGRLMIPVLEYTVEVDHFRPRALWRGKERLLPLRTESTGGYWSVLVGVSHLRGPESTEIYIVNTGPRGVCCTNYWIIDVSSRLPSEIFRSEAFGDFRGPAEIFDNDGDGTYELVRFDSCFRYFMNDCGSCSPEPRVTFSFDKGTERYRPAVGLMQDFARADLGEHERKLEDRLRSLDATDLRSKLDLESSALDYFVQKLHVGDEEEAWRALKRYIPKPSKKMLAEIRSRLRACPFYQAIHSGSGTGR